MEAVQLMSASTAAVTGTIPQMEIMWLYSSCIALSRCQYMC